MTFLEKHIVTRHPNSPQTAATAPKTAEAGGWSGVDRRAPVKGPRAAFERIDSFIHHQDSLAMLCLRQEADRRMAEAIRGMTMRVDALCCLQAGIIDAASFRKAVAI